MSAFTTLLALPIPSVDPLGYPVPVWILKSLTYLTLTLHFLAMQFTLGSAILWLYSRARKGPHDELARRTLGTGLPLGFSYLVTLGIPPLLFVQVLYGQFYYSSSVLMGAFWILVVPLLIVAYGLFYLHKMTRASRPSGQAWIVGIGVLVMLTIGYFYSNNFTLMQTPEKWLEMYGAHPGGGTLNFGEPTRMPRLVLVLSPSVAIAGLGLLIAGAFLRRRDRVAEGTALQRLGVGGMVVGTLLALAGGFWLFARLPEHVATGLVSDPLASIALYAGVGLALLAVVVGGISSRLRCGITPIAAALLAALSIASMVIVRDAIRDLYLAPFFTTADVAVQPQWGMFFGFVAALVMGLALVVLLTILVVRNLLKTV
jgi:hypothetical protein